MKVLLIIPAYNEEENILRTIASIETFKQEVTHFQHELDYVVINDGSTDGTKQILEVNQINAIHLVLNLGIGGAVQTGYKYALENEYDVAVQFDGDGQHDINSLPILLEPLAEGKCDFRLALVSFLETKRLFKVRKCAVLVFVCYLFAFEWLLVKQFMM